MEDFDDCSLNFGHFSMNFKPKLTISFFVMNF